LYKSVRGRATTIVLLIAPCACSFDWDAVDPRLASSGAGGGGSSSAGNAQVTGGAGSSSAGKSSGGSSSGAGETSGGDAGSGEAGSGGADEPGDVYLYWVDSEVDRVSRARPVSTAAPETLVDLGAKSSYFLRSLVVDTARDRIYFSDSSASVIRRANGDGSNVVSLVSGLAQPMSLALDTKASKLYWADQGETAKIQRANLDGSDVEDLVVDPVVQHPYGIALDQAKGQLYFIDNATDQLLRCNVDGSDVTDLEIPNLGAPIELALDLSAGKIYWSDIGVDGGPAPSIRRANLDGSGVEDVITSKNFPSLAIPLGLDVDVARGFLYFVDGGSGGTGVIARASLNGSNAMPLIVGLPEARGLKVVPD
jgi:hypothetical protein